MEWSCAVPYQGWDDRVVRFKVFQQGKMKEGSNDKGLFMGDLPPGEEVVL